MRLYLSSYRLGEHPEELVRHPESAASDAVAERYRSTGVPHVTLRDGQAMVVDGNTTTVV